MSELAKNQNVRTYGPKMTELWDKNVRSPLWSKMSELLVQKCQNISKPDLWSYYT